MDKPEEPLAYHEERLPNGYVSYSVTQRMTEPTGSPHVRSVAIYIPRQIDVPNISMRIVSHEGSALMMVSSLKVDHDVAGYMQIAVAAQTLPPDGGPATGVHFCNIVAIGKPLGPGA